MNKWHKFFICILVATVSFVSLWLLIVNSSSNETVEVTNTDVRLENRLVTFMPLTGTRWVYEGKRTYYDSETQSVQEVMAQKVVEVTGVTGEGDNVRATYKETYTNDPDFTEKEGSFLFSDKAFAFDGENVIKFPLESGQRLSFDNLERNDGYYDYYVGAVSEQEIFGKSTTCYEITYKTLADEENKVFCEGMGYIRDQYVHNGTTNEADYRLVGIPRPDESI